MSRRSRFIISFFYSRMFEEEHKVVNKINPHSLNPHKIIRPPPGVKAKEHPEYEDTSEYRKSLNMAVS